MDNAKDIDLKKLQTIINKYPAGSTNFKYIFTQLLLEVDDCSLYTPVELSEIAQNKGIDFILNAIYKLTPREIRCFASKIQSFVFDSELAETLIQGYRKNLVKKLQEAKSMEEFFDNFYSHKGMSSKYDEFGNIIKDSLTMQKEVICEMVCEDTLHNVTKLISELKVFYDCHKKNNGISSEEMEAISKVFEFEKELQLLVDGDFANFKSIYKKLYSNKTELAFAIYDARLLARKKVAKEYTDSLTDFNKFPSKTINGVQVYSAKGEKFGFFINVARDCFNYESPEAIKYTYDYCCDTERLSVSYLTNKELFSFRSLEKNIAFGFNKVDPDTIINISSRDNYTSYRHGDKAVSNHQEYFGRPQDMENESIKSKEYNEINILNYKFCNDGEYQAICECCGKEFADKYSGLKPNFIFCLDEPKEIHLGLAKLMNIPIVVADGKKYEYRGESTDSKNYYFDPTL